MTREEIEFVRNLNLDQLHILKDLLQQSQNRLEAESYIELLLSGADLSCNMIELLKNIPIAYLPVFGIDLSRLASYAPTIYDYYIQSFQKRRQDFGSVGKLKEACLQSASDLVLTYLQEEYAYRKNNYSENYTGRVLLDLDLDQKQELIMRQQSEIYDYLSDLNGQYVFAISKTFDIRSSRNQNKVIEILARYSHYDDLIHGNIESFQKFIKK